jgi:transcription elongation factor Elf1
MKFDGIMGRRKTQKIIRTAPKNVTTGLCPKCQTVGRIFLIGQVGAEHAKCASCNQEFDL